jgi:hypothetical protein
MMSRRTHWRKNIRAVFILERHLNSLSSTQRLAICPMVFSFPEIHRWPGAERRFGRPEAKNLNRCPKIVLVALGLVAAVLSTSPASASIPPSGSPERTSSLGSGTAGPESVVANDDRRRLCASVLTDWTEIDVLRNDLGPRLRLTEIGSPSNGEARLIDGRVEYRDLNGNGTYWVHYRIQDRRGHEDLGFWRVTADRSC